MFQYFLDPDGTHGFLFASGGSECVVGLTPQQLVESELIWAMILPEHIPEMQAGMMLSAQNCSPFHAEFRLRSSTGELKWIREHSVPEPPDQNGRVIWNGILTDITAERELLASIEEQKLQFQSIANNMPGVLFQFTLHADQSFAVSYVSDGIQDLLGLSPDEFGESGQNPFELIEPRRAEIVFERMMRSAKTMENWNFEEEIRRADGGHVWMRVSSTPTRSPDGTVVWNGVAIDVTKRRKAGEALRASEERLRTYIDYAPTGVFVANSKGKLVDVNPTGCIQVGYSREELLNMTVVDLVIADQQAEAFDTFNAIMNGESGEYVFSIRKKDGAARWMSVNGVLLNDSRVMGFVTDIHDRRIADEQLRESNSEKESMLKEIHHRVKNNLQVICSLLNLQAERIDDPQNRSVFLESQNRVKAMAFVHETLYGSESLDRVELSSYIDRLCDSLIQTFGESERVTIERSISPMKLDLDKALPIGLIISELLTNALKYAFPKQQIGRISVAIRSNEDGSWELVVSDDGIGLPSSIDLNQTNSMGIYLVNILVRQLKGEMRVSTDKGTTFRIRVPV